MSEEMEVVKIEKKKWSLEMVAALVWLVSQCIFCIAYLFGGFSSADENMSVLSVAFKVFHFFSITDKLWYHYISLLVHCIVFIVIAVLLIKSVIRGIRYFCDSTSRLSGTQEEFYNTFKYCIIYVLIANMLYVNFITGWGIFLFLLGLLIVTGGRVLTMLVRDRKLRWQYLAVKGTYTLVLGIIISAIGVLICRDVISNLISGISIIFSLDLNIGILNTIYQILGIDVIHILLTIFFIRIVDKMLFEPTDWEHKEIWKSLFITACVYIGIDITLYFIMQYGSEEFNIFQLIINYISVARSLVLPIVMLAGAGWITFAFPDISKYKKEEQANKEDLENCQKEVVEKKQAGENINEIATIEILEPEK